MSRWHRHVKGASRFALSDLWWSFNGQVKDNKYALLVEFHFHNIGSEKTLLNEQPIQHQRPPYMELQPRSHRPLLVLHLYTPVYRHAHTLSSLISGAVILFGTKLGCRYTVRTGSYRRSADISCISDAAVTRHQEAKPLLICTCLQNQTDTLKKCTFLVWIFSLSQVKAQQSLG